MSDETESIPTIYSAGWVAEDYTVATPAGVQPLPAMAVRSMAIEDARARRDAEEEAARREEAADNFGMAMRLQGRPGSGEPWATTHEEVIARASRIMDAQAAAEARHAALYEDRPPLAKLQAEAQRSAGDVTARRMGQHADAEARWQRILARHRARRRGPDFAELLGSAVRGGSLERREIERLALKAEAEERHAARYDSRTGQYR
jgi:hypothetical protein